jgi:hypothetical protein
MLEAGAEVEIARVSETNHRVAADRILCPGGSMWHRAGRGWLEPEIPTESMAYGAGSERLLLSEAGAGNGRANSPDARNRGRMEENVRQKAPLSLADPASFARSRMSNRVGTDPSIVHRFIGPLVPRIRRKTNLGRLVIKAGMDESD